MKGTVAEGQVRALKRGQQQGVYAEQVWGRDGAMRRIRQARILRPPPRARERMSHATQGSRLPTHVIPPAVRGPCRRPRQSPHSWQRRRSGAINEEWMIIYNQSVMNGGGNRLGGHAGNGINVMNNE